LVPRFLGNFLLCPAHSQKTAIPATLHAILRINKTLVTPRRYPNAEPDVDVFGQALASAPYPATGKTLRSIAVAANAGTAFDGRHLYQLAGDRIQKIDPKTGRVLATISAPDSGCSGLTWAEGTLWVGQYRDRKIYQIDPETGAILRTIESNRFVTGVTWVDGELWHGTWEGDQSELRRIDPKTGEVLERVEMPPGVAVSGLESDGGKLFFCGGGSSGKVRTVRRPKRGSAKSSSSTRKRTSSSKKNN
jgi:outer membrane protein assembly factor BamB